MSETNHIIRKLEFQDNPTILFTDIDGTLFSPNLNILTAPLYNFQTALFLRQRHIPFIIVTGRSFWRRVDQYHLRLLGVAQPDVAITANGTIILYKNGNHYVSDFVWQGVMQSTKVVDLNGKVSSWNKLEITDTISKYLKENNFPFFLGQGNTYLIRIRFNTYPMQTIEKIKKDILHIFPKGVRIILTEKLLWQNTLEIFSGELLITPSTAGKDKAVAYVLKNLAEEAGRHLHGILFGDATVDLPMLTMNEDTKYYSLSQYILHPTSLAKEIAEENEKKNPNFHILHGDGPKEILWTLRPELRKQTTPQEKETMNDEPTKHELLSPAQNNKTRNVIQLFEKILDRIVDKNLSPNEVSFLGLKKLSHGLKLLHKKNNSIYDKTKGVYHYSFGNLTDILDGIRARNSNKKEENGQLVDGFSDRTKEFMQLFIRGQKRLNNDNDEALTTFLVCISCTLPSIARAQVEITGKTVSERDEQGGSMIDRTRRLFLSLLFDTLGLPDQSYGKDVEIYTTNIATFQHRLSFVKDTLTNLVKNSGRSEPKDFSDFQKKALERFLLYVDVLQQEDGIIKKYLSKYPKVLKDYKNQSEKIAKDYFEFPVGKLRKKWGIKDYKLQIKDYL